MPIKRYARRLRPEGRSTGPRAAWAREKEERPVENQTFRPGDRVSLDEHLRKLYPDLRPSGVVVVAEPVEGLVPVRPDGCLTTSYFHPDHLRRERVQPAPDERFPGLDPAASAPPNPGRQARVSRFRKAARRLGREWVRGAGGARPGF